MSNDSKNTTQTNSGQLTADEIEMPRIDLENKQDDLLVLFLQCDYAEQDCKDAQLKLRAAREQHGDNSREYIARSDAIKTMYSRWQTTIKTMQQAKDDIDALTVRIRVAAAAASNGDGEARDE